MNKNSIEYYLHELSMITEKMNNTDLTLDESIELYKKGSEIANKAKSLMNKYSDEIKIITEKETTDDGKL